jgi:hypothetical protein
MDWKSEFVQEQIFIEQTKTSLATRALAHFVIYTGLWAGTGIAVMNFIGNAGSDTALWMRPLSVVIWSVWYLFIATTSIGLLRQAKKFDVDDVRQMLGESK